MSNRSEILNRIESGKQIGTTFSFFLNNEECWSTVAIQKAGKKYLVSYDEILEKNMAQERYNVEELISFDSLNDALSFIENSTRADINLLQPGKGQKFFDASLPPTQYR